MKNKLFRMLFVLAFCTVALSCASLQAHAENSVEIDFGSDSNVVISSLHTGEYVRMVDGHIREEGYISNGEIPSGAIGILWDGTVVMNNFSYTYNCQNRFVNAITQSGIVITAQDSVDMVIKGQCSIGIAIAPDAIQGDITCAMKLKPKRSSDTPDFTIMAGDSSAKLTLSAYPAPGRTTGTYQGISCAGSLDISCIMDIYAGMAPGDSYGIPVSCTGIAADQMTVNSGAVVVHANGAQASGSCVGVQAQNTLMITHGTLAVICEGNLQDNARCFGVITSQLVMKGWEGQEGTKSRERKMPEAISLVS